MDIQVHLIWLPPNFIKPMVPHELTLFLLRIARPDITYPHQKIPPAYSMPAFEDINSIIPDVYSNIKYRTVNSPTDITDTRTEQYAKRF